jgi:tetratricopeptide (TPR) repeat protein
MLSEDDPRLLLAQGDFASLLFDAGKYEEALERILPVLDAGRKLAPKHPRLRDALHQVGYELMLSCRFSEAEKLLREALDIGFDSPHKEQEALQALASILVATRKPKEALEVSQRSLSLQLTQPPAIAWRSYVHCRVLELAGGSEKAKASLKDSVSRYQALAPDSLSALDLGRMAIVLSHAQEPMAAIEARRLALEREESTRPALHPRIADQLCGLGAEYLQTGQVELAKPLLEKTLAIRSARLPQDDPRIEESRRLLSRLAEQTRK